MIVAVAGSNETIQMHTAASIRPDNKFGSLCVEYSNELDDSSFSINSILFYFSLNFIQYSSI